MTEIERLRADLATLEAAQETINQIGKNRYTSSYWVEFAIVTDLKKRIADIEAQAQADNWAEVKQFIDQSPDEGSNPPVKKYIRHLESKVAELELELRCEQIDGGKVRDDRKAISAENSREKLAELTTIQNAIPAACGLARELVQKRIEGIKREMQGNESSIN